jgi:hypothetical protein
MKFLKNTTEANKTYLGQTILPGEYFEIPIEDESLYAKNDTLLLDVANGNIVVSRLGDVSGEISSFNESILFLQGNLPSEVRVTDSPELYPFAQKVLKDGKKLFRRKHGKRQIIPKNSIGIITFEVPYVHCKIDEVEIINCCGNDNVDLKVLDNAAGTFSGVPNYVLNQFGFNVCLSDLYYTDSSNYDADLYQSMIIEVTYYNNFEEDKNIGINFVLHEVV